ncbi:MAG TPA: AmmeMemoRadiSam system radical SAM enzyme [Candidatus Polarisedimenticolia bacterium]|nr:AmmeMemoRadiSam system radical SAM enzyme [Candidatus Polarisedimenticolia bacterium]
MSTARTETPLAGLLGTMTRTGEIWAREGDAGGLRCFACGHRCFIPMGRPGVCRVRFNDSGTLRVPWGYVAALQCDPIEKKPFFHVLPGARALSFGMLGCDLHCAYCQNWITSQALRDPEAVAPARRVEPAFLADEAVRLGAPVLASTYNEPLITSEWGVAVFREAAARGILGAYVSNGNATEEVLDYIQPWVSAYKIDLKAFRDRTYRSLGGTLRAVQESIRSIVRRGIWLEVVTLVVPGLNDEPEELRDIARFLRSVSPDIPWHLTAFHPDYKMQDRPATAAAGLRRAAEEARADGMRFVYVGNLPGMAGEFESTRCPDCATVLVPREGYRLGPIALDAKGACPRCGRALPGIFAGGVRHPAQV